MADENINVVGRRRRHDPNELRLVINGKDYAGWESARVTRGVERMPNDFEVAVTERYPGQGNLVGINPGDACRVMIGDDRVITGYVDRYNTQIGPGQHEVKITGRGRCQDLVDCAAGVVAPGRSLGGNYAATTLPALFTAITEPFGITVDSSGAGTAANKPVPQFIVNFGETPFEIIDRVARYGQCLAYEGADGNLIVSQVGTTAAASGFVQGVNVQSMSTTRSMDERFSVYLASFVSVDSLSQLQEAIPQPASEQGFFDGSYADAGVKRFRPRVIVSEQVQSGIDVCKARAVWEGKRRYGRSQVATVVVDSWRDSAGTLWTPNTLAPISLPAGKVVPQDRWLIGQVTFQRDASGTTATITLMSPEAYMPEPSILQGVDFQTYDALHPLNSGLDKP